MFASEAAHAFCHRAVISKRRHLSAKVWHLTTEVWHLSSKVRHLSSESWHLETSLHRAVIAEGWHTLAAESERFFSEVVARCRHAERQFLDGDILLALDAPAPVASSNHVERALTREQ